MTSTLTKMTKVEVVVAGKDAPAVRELIGSVGATGFTSLSGVSGLGHHGFGAACEQRGSRHAV